jgi:hypothetical protein
VGNSFEEKKKKEGTYLNISKPTGLQGLTFIVLGKWNTEVVPCIMNYPYK